MWTMLQYNYFCSLHLYNNKLNYFYAVNDAWNDMLKIKIIGFFYFFFYDNSKKKIVVVFFIFRIIAELTRLVE